MLHQIAPRVEDRQRAVDFYRDVLRLPPLADFPGLSFFDLGGGARLFVGQAGEQATLYLGVDDIEGEYSRLRGEGVEFIDAPHLIHTHDGRLGLPAGTEEWMAFFRDPEGNLLALSERRAPRS